MPFIGGGMVAASVVGGLLGGSAQKKAQAQAMAMAREAAAAYGGIIPPEVKALIVESLQQQGLYTPETEDAIDLGESQVAQIQEDPALRLAQMNALQQMSQVSRTGFRPEDRAALNQIRNEVQRDIQAKNAQILQQMQARGLGGSGAELAMQIAASQQGADLGAEQADRLAAQASQSALAALANYGQMAGSVRGQDFDVNRARSSAADEFRRFNVQNQQNVGQRNVSSRNQAQAANLAEAQRISEANIANRYNEQVRQENARQQRFQNEMAKASGIANALTGQANMTLQAGQQEAQGWTNMASGVAGGLGALANYNRPSGTSNVAAPTTTKTPDVNTNIDSYLKQNSKLLGR